MNDTIILFISNILTAAAGWFVGKKKADAETDNQVLKNLELAVSVYVTIIEDLKQEITQLNVKVELLEKKVEELMNENKKLKRKNGL